MGLLHFLLKLHPDTEQIIITPHTIFIQFENRTDDLWLGR